MTSSPRNTASQHYSALTRCRACGNERLAPILDLGSHALTGRFPRANEPDPPVVPLQLVMCDVTEMREACGLVQLAHTCDLNLMYGPSYGYRSSITKTMVAHLHATADRLMALAGVQAGDCVLEVGANDGTTQRYLSGRGLDLVAVDPSAAKFAESYPPDSTLIVDFFSVDAVRAVRPTSKFKAIISLSVFYDLEQPLEFMKAVRQFLDKDGVWCFEQSYMPTMYSSLCYDTICHEHLNYYGIKQIEWMAKRAGLRLLDISMNDINGGSFMVYACREDSSLVSNGPTIRKFLTEEKTFALEDKETWRVFEQRVGQHKTQVRSFFEGARAAGDLVVGLGASTKGNVILQYAGVTSDMLPAIGERDPLKVGLRTPRTAIPIVSEETARSMKPRFFFIGPWHFRREIVDREHAFLEGGGGIVFPLPQFEIVSGMA